MIRCSKCSCTFTLIDRLKIMINGKPKCKKCNSIYKVKGSIIRGLYFFITIMGNTGYILLLKYLDRKVNILPHILFPIIFILVYDLIPHKFQRYTKIK